MRMKEGFVLREIAGQAMVIATGEASKGFHGMVKLNGTGREIWQGLTEGLSEEEIVEKMVGKYEVDAAKAAEDIRQLLDEMEKEGFLVR